MRAGATTRCTRPEPPAIEWSRSAVGTVQVHNGDGTDPHDAHTGLTPLQEYYAGEDGALTTDDDVWYPRVGKALSPTELLLKIE